MTDAIDEVLMLDAVDRWLERDVVPHVREFEHADIYPSGMVEQMKELGLFGATISTQYGGLGLNASLYARIVTRISAVWMSLTGTSVQASWQTNEAADGELAFTSHGAWWPNPYTQDGPECSAYVADHDVDHSVTVRVLQEDTEYKFEILVVEENGNRTIWEIELATGATECPPPTCT